MTELKYPETEGPWKLASKVLPPEGRYVLVHLANQPWSDSDDQGGVFYAVAKMKRGLSLEDRQKMKAGVIPDEVYPLALLETSLRSKIHTEDDEYGNNLRPYRWHTFGPSKYFGQEVDYWMEIPR